MRDESRTANDIECSDAKHLRWVIHAGLLQRLNGDGEGAVNGVGDDEDESRRTSLGNSSSEVADHTRVDLKQIWYFVSELEFNSDNGSESERSGGWEIEILTITCHPRFAGNASWDHDEFRPRQGFCETVVCRQETGDFACGVDVIEIDGHAWSVDDIVEGEGAD